ncbi:MAG: hypothetical protein Q9186_005194 [Xanthomendoza sp. 1 TL-2023]
MALAHLGIKHAQVMANTSKEPIAIIGSSCRFPGEANTPSNLWKLLQDPRDLLREIPSDRFSARGFYHPDGLHHGNSNVLHAYLLSEDHRLFDAKFFGIKGVEASAIDPQQRLLLETTYEGIESAGLRMDDLRGSDTAVYVGLMCGDYEAMLLRDLDSVPTYHATGIARSIMANRISYFFDWHGPSMTIDTACSSSLVAVHQAVQSLRSGESRIAIAAGSNLILGPENYIAESKLKMLSPTGRSRMWDQDADGYARGEGVASVVLKTLSAALADGDQIECLIRETGVNQDGRTRGITMPSAAAQTALIRSTYAKAGLDPLKKSDRCQFFEAHGTGTPTGDPLEAEAVEAAFFSKDQETGATTKDKLYVGSIKTVIGHTEGTAGLAAMLKASLAIQNGILPPNLLFNQLNPSIEPFYSNLCVPTESQLWPYLPAGHPRRASVNSFGFGGTNAHAILESYEPKKEESVQDQGAIFSPFTFSASTESSLVSQLKVTLEYLAQMPPPDIRDLSFSLNRCRTVFPTKVAFAAQSVEELHSKIQKALKAVEEDANMQVGVKSSSTVSPTILGIFTGQGAQYAEMGADLLLHSAAARRCCEALEHSLITLPPADRPHWSLTQELLAKVASSRLSEAALSQPLCTAVQIMLVDILRESGIKFKAVLGHSSGEIGAAYAAGFISAQDAIRIAYYRGVHSKLAVGRDGVKGAMMAVSTSKEDAQELCEMPDFEGRMTVAAINSAASITLSGDEDAIIEAKIIFDDEKKKATILKVDKAYHSPHMNLCSDAYLESMKGCHLKVQNTEDSTCIWYSSVSGEAFYKPFAGLAGLYWNDNLVRPVQFMRALTKALEQNPFIETVIEVGPHPALKGPAIQTIQDVLQKNLPYTGLLRRGINSIDAMAEGAGFLWTHLGERSLNLVAFNEYLVGDQHGKLLKGLPTYQWDHDREYWQESRVSRVLRTRKDPVHDLLGSRCPDGSAVQMSWRNLLRMAEIPWLRDHALQGQTIFPAAGYVATAIEASKFLPDFASTKFLEVKDFVIHQPLVFSDEDLGVETLFTFFGITSKIGESTDASFTYHAASSKDSDSMTLMASGHLRILGESLDDTELPARPPFEPNMIEVGVDRFYDSLADIGYGYTGPFRALSSLERKLDRASGLVANPITKEPNVPLLVHPAMLDGTIQAVILAYCYPNDGQLWSLHLPTSIAHIRVDVKALAKLAGQSLDLPFDSHLSKNARSGIYGDVNVYNPHSQHALLQLEGMRAVPFTGATKDDDFHVFSSMEWGLAVPDGEAVIGFSRASPTEYELAYSLERVASFYLRLLDQEIPESHSARTAGPYVGLFNYAKHVNSWVASGKHPYAKQEWGTDTLDYILTTSNQFPDSPDLKIMHIVGRQMPRVIHGETTILEHLLPNNLLDNYYSNALGFPQFTMWLSRMAALLTHRYPRMKILEIGAGTGGATKGILKHIDQWYSSYTFTDVSNGFFDNAQEVFQDHTDKMDFKVLDVEKDVTVQGFEEASYDLIIASFVLHATAKLEHTMKNVRRLLKPGGHVLMAEVTNNDQIRGGFIFGALPGWWLGAEDGRILSPCVSPAQWDSILRRTGFSGIDSITSDQDNFPYPGSIILSQAVDPQIKLLRRPLIAPCPPELRKPLSEGLLILGGATLRTRVIVEELSETLTRFYSHVDVVETISEVTSEHLLASTCVLSLVELDEPVFENITAQSFEGLKRVCSQERVIMWFTHGRRAESPESNMTYGFVRSQLWEVPDLHTQLIDLESASLPGSNFFAETFVRFCHLIAWEKASQLQKVLWSVEPELVFKDNHFLIPRLSHWKSANDRLNSAKRRIVEKAALEDTRVGIIKQEGLQTLMKCTEPSRYPSSVNIGCIDIKVAYSLALPKPQMEENLSIIVGIAAKDHSLRIAVANPQVSSVCVPKAQTIFCDSDLSDVPRLMVLFAYRLMADYMLSKVFPGDTIMIHEPGAILSQLVAQSALEKGINTSFTTCNIEDKSTCFYIHPYATKSDIASTVPQHLSIFFDLSTSRSSKRIGRMVTANLPSSCDVDYLDQWLCFPLPGRVEETLMRLRLAYEKAIADTTAQVMQPNVAAISIQEFAQSNIVQGTMQLLDWTASPVVDVDVQPVDTNSLFAKDKTYWLVGLTGGLGLSLCEWMVHHGARFLVLSSRNPKVDEQWRRSMAALGAVVRISANDITDRDAVRSLYHDINATMPAVGGVAQGAMILHDTPTRDMSYEDLNRVLKPKVDGSRYLDELFQENTLDFFVFFSSMTGVVGNMGQSNYTAANTFMCALANQRRSKGLAASVINIGVIIGVGYVTREVSHADQKNLRKGGYMWMSERDFHQIFAEAVLAGRPDSKVGPEISTGLRRISPDEPYQPIWFHNPVFAKCLIQQGAAVVQEASGNSGPSLKTRLQAAINEAQVTVILEDCFTAQLQSLLGGTLDDTQSKKAILESHTDELGIDSLIAVEIRSWFLNNLGVNIPVLKILSGAVVSDLILHALKELPGDLLPNVGASSEINPLTTNAVSALDLSNPQPATSNQGSDSSAKSLDDQPTGKEGFGSTSDSTASSLTSDVDSGSGADTPLEKPVVIRELALSFSQSMFWFITVYLADKTTLNHFGYSRVSGRLRIPDLRRAVDVVAQRHEALRTCFFTNELQQPMQGVMETSPLRLEHKWIKDDVALVEECSKLKTHRYDLESGEVMKIVLLSRSAEEHYLLIGCHHINLDGISHQVLMSDLQKVYDHKPLSTDFLQYPDHSLSQEAQKLNGGWGRELLYWKEEMKGFDSVLPLLSPSSVVSRRPLEEYALHKINVRLDRAIASRVKDVCRRIRVTPFHFYLSVFKVLLFRFSSTNDLCIGIADANRTESNMMDSIGPFVNLLPLRFRREASQSFRKSLEEARSKSYGALSNAAVPFEMILDELDVTRSVAHSPIFQAFLDYRQGARETMTLGECKLDMIEFHAGRTAYDLSLDVFDDSAGQPLLMFIAQASLYSLDETQILTQSYMNLVEVFAGDPDLEVAHAPLYKTVDTEKALELGRGTFFESEWAETLPHRIQQMVDQYGGKTAVKESSGNSMTYKELSHGIDTIATRLLDSGIIPGSVVAVFQELGLEWICSLLAILKVGAVYLPLDVGTPLVRLAVIAADGNTKVILVNEGTKNLTTPLEAEQLIVMDVSITATLPIAEVPILAKSGMPAVILYTSGSTGAPKGIVLSHRNFINEVEVSSQIYSLGPEDVILQQSALNFDMSLLQIFLPLALGGTLCLIPRSARGDPQFISRLLHRENVSFTCATPSEYTNWINYGERASLQRSAWKVALSGGEPVTPGLLHLLQSLHKPDLRLYNGYGPTETTCCSTKVRIDYHQPDHSTSVVSAGRPSPNESIYILDENLRLLPVGVPGEIVIGGVGVAIGYLHNQQMTSNSFIPDIFATSDWTKEGWTTMYRTGDRGRWRSDGSLSLEGRLDGDTQIKLRGIRIDLREIENTILLAAKGLLAACVVSSRSDPEKGVDYLVAFVVFQQTISAPHRRWLLEELPSSLPLPQYMHPAVVIAMDWLPVNNSGKVDRRSIAVIPITPESEASSDFTKLTSFMSRLKEIWSEILPAALSSHHRIEPDSDFFHVGGNSILLVRLQALIERAMGISIPLVQLFSAPTLREMANCIEDKSETSHMSWIDWDAETKPEPDWNQNITVDLEATLVTAPRIVVLTGATGLLGPYLVEQLVSDPRVEKVHCLAVRGEDNQNFLQQTDKVAVHPGDLTLPRLGLSEDTAQEIFHEADVVIHNAADVSHLKVYQTLRLANVDSTKELVRLCLGRRTPIHYISTAGVALFTPRKVFGEVSVASTPPPTDGSDGYTSSKWASERFLERATETYGLPVWIHRPSSITRSSGLLGEDAMEMELLQNLLKYSRLMKAVIVSSKLQGELDLVSAENVAAGIVSRAIASREGLLDAPAGVTYVHQTGDFCLPISEMRGFLETETQASEPYEELSISEWVDRATDLGLHIAVGAAFKKVEKMGLEMMFPSFVKGHQI